MSSDAHLRRDHSTPSAPIGSDPYIDWGPDLPGRYDGGRARVLVANPHALFVTWESGSTPAGWRVELQVLGGHGEPGATMSLSLPGVATDAWLSAPARARGVIRLFHDGSLVATLPFETPPDMPSDDVSERWGRVDDHGALQAASAVDGRAIGPEAIGPIGSMGQGAVGAAGYAMPTSGARGA